MAIVQNVNFSLFCDAFVKAGRENNFSYKGKKVLFNYLEELSDGMGESIELDIISICCDYREDDAETIAEQYNIDLSDCDDGDIEETVAAFLNDNSLLVGNTSSGFVYSVF